MPPEVTPGHVTRLLHCVRAGETDAAESLLSVVYHELGGLARAQLSNERRDHTLQPTALVHEAWLKLAAHIDQLEDRQHFFAIAAQAMRQVLTDHARGRGRQKRGGQSIRITLDPSLGARPNRGLDLIDLDDSLSRLQELHERHARVVELRIFGGLTINEIAKVLGVSPSTVDTDWSGARAWLRRELGRTA